MSKAKNRTDPTAATIALKNKRVEKSSHGKFKTIVELEKHRIEVTARNLKGRKNKKNEED